MAVEVACWQCHGRLMIATPGVVVACPHCGAHLQWPPPNSTPQPAEFEAAPVPEQSILEHPAHEHPVAPAIEPAPALIPEPSTAAIFNPQMVPVGETLNPPAEIPEISPVSGSVGEVAPTAATPPTSPVQLQVQPILNSVSDAGTPGSPSHVPTLATTGGEVNFLSSLAFNEHSQNSAFTAADSPQPSIQEIAERSASFNRLDEPNSFQNLTDQTLNESITSVSSSMAAVPAPAGGSEPVPTSESPSISFQHSSSTISRPSERTSGSDTAPVPAGELQIAQRKVPMLLFIIVLSYASAMTLAFGYLIYKSRYGMPHQLESLPDLKPPQKKGVVAAQILIPVFADLPKGHTLYLGESRRFGNVRVTPLRVTKEPLRFEHYTGDAKKQRPATEPVLKLWLRFENVSSDQEFCPLDRDLLLSRAQDPRNAGETRSNQYVMKYSDKPDEKPRVQIYDLPPSDVWEFSGNGTYPEMTPGQQWETYIPTTVEGIESLEGDLVWRVHIRKGYNPETFRGVTTLLEVRFNSDEIERGST